MNFLKAAHTDIGIKKDTNQDSVLIQEANTDHGRVLLAVVCDGMGGLAKGEIASSTVITHVSEWFSAELADILYTNPSADVIRDSLDKFVHRMNDCIQTYSKRNRCNMGTTFVSLLIIGNQYYITNVGDSRVYRIKDSFEQLTKDQTYVQREIDMGRMTYEEGMNSPQRNVLLQCIGTGDYLAPDFYTDTVESGENFLLCTDGFRHVITEGEFYQYLSPYVLKSEGQMKEALEYFVELNKYRQETDNISAVVIRTD